MTVHKATKAGAPVELRTEAGKWVTVDKKPKARRGKNYMGHVRAVALQFDGLGVPPSVANFRRMGISRRSKLRRALAQIAIEETAVTPPTESKLFIE
jgi:hypothetical protein